ncbi:N-acetylglucosamine kinase [Streptomyces ficellus]|uniref:ATPase n=1 Tax=Streptomyces ficellus TaxID=1977088 RepID=A0A6I6FNL8_9ACTN|nr:BadF/BadG/BcrA/BcrD ATPase family protein [Streptomyces ficellus]QGV81892.1 ATPase [Streptomyces ficellus]
MSGGAWVLGVDSGGSGLRIALGAVPGGAGASAAGDPGGVRAVGSVEFGEPVRTGAGGIDAGHLLERLVPAAEGLLRRAGADGPTAEAGLAAVAVGAAGMTTLGDDLRATLPDALRRSLGAGRLALAADAVTAYAGALGQRPGAVVAAGTGLIAVGTDLSGGWRRADGWGHLLGDCGGGAWIGRAGLEAALRAHDGRRGGSAALLARVEAVFGPPASLPGRLYPRTDRAAVLASFAPEVARCATAGDPVAAGILARAARHVAEAVSAVCPPGADREVALAGGLFRMGDPLLVPLRAELAEHLPHARTVAAAGDPLDGALAVAAALATGTLRLPREPGMLETITLLPATRT